MPQPLPLLTLLAAALLAGCEPPPPREPLASDDLHLQARQLASLAAEAGLLVDEIGAAHLTHSFPWVHQQNLADQARNVEASLAQPAPGKLQAAQRQALQLAATLQGELTRLAALQDQPGELRSLGERFAQLRAQAKALEAAE